MNITQEKPSLLNALIEEKIFFNAWLAVEIGDKAAIVLTAIARESLLKRKIPAGVIFSGSSSYRMIESAGLSRQAIFRLTKKLEALGLIEESNLSRLDAERILKRKPPADAPWMFEKECSWCHTKTARLHEHHHPIPKSEGGRLTVSICPNCHTEFHQLVDYPIFSLSTAGRELLIKHYYGEFA